MWLWFGAASMPLVIGVGVERSDTCFTCCQPVVDMSEMTGHTVLDTVTYSGVG